MKSNTPPNHFAMAHIFDEMSVQLQLMALNFAFESVHIEGCRDSAEKIFHEAINLCDATQFTALEISSLLKSTLGVKEDTVRPKVLDKLQELARHIEKISRLAGDGEPLSPNRIAHATTQSYPNAVSQGTPLSEQVLCQKSLSRKTVEIQNMLKQFTSALEYEKPIVS